MLIVVLTLLTATSLGIDDIPSNYISTKPLKSLFCNTCSVLSTIINETLHDDSADFESLVGFRLDSNGKKIRKQSGWLKLFLSLEDLCDDWKGKYRVAKRKNDYLYLIENEIVRAMAEIERKRKHKLEKEASDRLNKQWDQEWDIERLRQELLWNATHDQDGNLIDNTDTDETNDTDVTQEKEKNDVEPVEDVDDGPAPRYFKEKKVKLVKKKSKQQKIVAEMCYFLSEKFDEWLHEKQKKIAKQMNEGDEIKDFLVPLLFCVEDKICAKEMFDVRPKVFKFKKELKLPKKPKRTWTPPQLKDIVDGDYEEEMEDDIDEVGDGSNGTQTDDNHLQGESEVLIDDNNDKEPKSEL